MLRVENLWKTYVAEGKRVPATRGVSFTVEQGEFYTLLGPSGCGKSTTLRCIAGLEQPERGEILIGTQYAFSEKKGIRVPAHQRDIGMVFQSYAIWPHMSVFDNVAFPLVHGRERHTKAEVTSMVDKALSLVHLEEQRHRPASLLSGGQQQRVALARALVYQPTLLLLDEPLSNLDARLRDEMRKEIKRLVRTLHITTLYVTHDQIEALSLSDRVGVMLDGVIVQEGTPREIYLAPHDGFVASFVGRANLFDGVIVGAQNGGQVYLVETELGRLQGSGDGHYREGETVHLSIRPEAITVHLQEPETKSNVLEGKIEVLTFVGDSSECQVSVGSSLIDVKVGLTKAEPGQSVYLHLEPKRCVVLPPRDWRGVPRDSGT